MFFNTQETQRPYTVMPAVDLNCRMTRDTQTGDAIVGPAKTVIYVLNTLSGILNRLVFTFHEFIR